MSSISFFSEDISFDLPQKMQISNWITNIAASEGYQVGHLNFIFCSDAYLLVINQHYLFHDYYTDIITFSSSDLSGVVEGDVFISIERVSDNASLLILPFLLELHRVIVHGVLHLIGYDDSSAELKSIMRQKEDSYLSLLST